MTEESKDEALEFAPSDETKQESTGTFAVMILGVGLLTDADAVEKAVVNVIGRAPLRVEMDRDQGQAQVHFASKALAQRFLEAESRFVLDGKSKVFEASSWTESATSRATSGKNQALVMKLLGQTGARRLGIFHTPRRLR